MSKVLEFCLEKKYKTYMSVHLNILCLISINLHYTQTHTHTQYHFTVLYLVLSGGLVPKDTFTHSHLKHVVGVCHHSGFYEAWGRFRGKCVDSTAECQPIWTIDAPTFHHPQLLCQMPFLSQPSLFISAWDRHQILWIAYLECLVSINLHYM